MYAPVSTSCPAKVHVRELGRHGRATTDSGSQARPGRPQEPRRQAARGALQGPGPEYPYAGPPRALLTEPRSEFGRLRPVERVSAAVEFWTTGFARAESEFGSLLPVEREPSRVHGNIPALRDLQLAYSCIFAVFRCFPLFPALFRSLWPSTGPGTGLRSWNSGFSQDSGGGFPFQRPYARR